MVDTAPVPSTFGHTLGHAPCRLELLPEVRQQLRPPPRARLRRRGGGRVQPPARRRASGPRTDVQLRPADRRVREAPRGLRARSVASRRASGDPTGAGAAPRGGVGAGAVHLAGLLGGRTQGLRLVHLAAAPGDRRCAGDDQRSRRRRRRLQRAHLHVGPGTRRERAATRESRPGQRLHLHARRRRAPGAHLLPLATRGEPLPHRPRVRPGAVGGATPALRRRLRGMGGQPGDPITCH